jgi:hypothetical protein
MIQAYRNVVQHIDRARQTMEINRNVCLLFNQMERDFSQAFISPLQKTIPKDKVANDNTKADNKKEADEENKDNKQDEPKTEEEKKAKALEAIKDHFIAGIDDSETARIEGRKFDLFKYLNFITTNTLQIWGQRRVYLVRVLYELVKDKAKSKGENICYNLYRKETTELTNVKMKEDEFADKKSTPIRTYLVATNVKSLYIEYTTLIVKEEKEQGKETEISEPTELKLFMWGSEKKDTIGKLPQKADVWISFWNDDLTSFKTFQATFPFYLFTIKKEKGSEKKEDQSKKLEAKKDELTQAVGKNEVPQKAEGPSTTSSSKTTSTPG